MNLNSKRIKGALLTLLVITLSLTGCLGGGGGGDVSYQVTIVIKEGTTPLSGVTVTYEGAKSGVADPTNDQGETQISSLKGTVNISFSLEGYTFNPQPLKVDKKGTYNVKATKVPDVTYTLNYAAEEGGEIEGEKEQTVKHGYDGSPVKAIAEQGYVFMQWSDGNTENPRTDRNVTCDISVTAEFSNEHYEITYHLDDGENDVNNPNLYKSTDNIELLPATKDEWAFDGWFSDNEFTEKVTEVGYGTSGNLVLYAKWLPFTFDPANNTITAYNTAGGEDVIIPANINGVDVYVIGQEAFKLKNLKSVEIPNGVTSIGEWAFANNGLTEVTIPDSVTSIGSCAFSDNELTKVVIPNSVTTIANHAFSDNELTKVVIPNSVTTIANHAFYKNKLTKVVIPNSVTTIANHAFSDNKLTEVTIPDNITIESNAFSANEQLREIRIGESVKLALYSFDYNFIQAYEEHGAGTYKKQEDGSWIKQ